MMNGGRDQASGGRNYKAGGCAMSRHKAVLAVLGATLAAAVLPVTVRAPSSLELQHLSQVVRLNTACAAEAAGGCKFNMQYICETSSGDHRFYRNNDDQVE
jgi:hypothetical protein